MKTKYNNYFEEHLGYSYKESDVWEYKKWFQAQFKFIESKIDANKGNILEIGSGIGGFYSFLEKAPQYMGIELDGKAVSFSNSYFKEKKFFNKSFEDLKNNSFDRIYAFEVLEHLDNPKESINKMFTMLNKGGIFCGTTPYPFQKNVLADETHLYVLHPSNWERLFKLGGFKEVDLYPMSFLPFVWRLNENFNVRIPFYVPFYGFISTCLIVARK